MARRAHRGNVLSFIDTRFSEPQLAARIAALIGNVRQIDTQPIALRSIYTTLARAGTRRQDASMIWRIVRKDWGQLWPLVAIVAMAQWTNTALWFSLGHFKEPRGLVIFAELFSFASVLGMVALITAAVQQDVLPGVSQDWLVRPIRRGDSASLAKLSVRGVVAVHGPMLLADLAPRNGRGFRRSRLTHSGAVPQRLDAAGVRPAGARDGGGDQNPGAGRGQPAGNLAHRDGWRGRRYPGARWRSPSVCRQWHSMDDASVLVPAGMFGRGGDASLCSIFAAPRHAPDLSSLARLFSRPC